MPLYLVFYSSYPHDKWETSARDVFFQRVQALHAHTFGCDPLTVRMEFLEGPGESHSRYGGLGETGPRGFLGFRKNSDFIIVHMDFRGTADEWENYCRELIKLRGKPSLRSIFLQRLEFEFEVHDAKLPGFLVRPEEKGGEEFEKWPEVEGSGKGKEVGGIADPPPYEKK